MGSGAAQLLPFLTSCVLGLGKDLSLWQPVWSVSHWHQAQEFSPYQNPGYFCFVFPLCFLSSPLSQRLNGSHRVQERVIESSRSTFEYCTSGKSLIQHLVVNHWYRKWHLTFYHSARNGRTRHVCMWWRWIVAYYLPLKGISCHLKGNVFKQGLFSPLWVPFCLRQTKNLENKSPSSSPQPPGLAC